MNLPSVLLKLLATALVAVPSGCASSFPSDRQVDRAVDTVQGIMAQSNPFIFIICVADITTRTFLPNVRDLTPAQKAAAKAAALKEIESRPPLP